MVAGLESKNKTKPKVLEAKEKRGRAVSNLVLTLPKVAPLAWTAPRRRGGRWGYWVGVEGGELSWGREKAELAPCQQVRGCVARPQWTTLESPAGLGLGPSFPRSPLDLFGSLHMVPLLCILTTSYQGESFSLLSRKLELGVTSVSSHTHLG